MITISITMKLCAVLASILSAATAYVGAEALEDEVNESCFKPLRIFLLLGQSNMVGQGSEEHLSLLLNNSETHDAYAHLWNDTAGSWAVRDDVHVLFDKEFGPLTMGYGDKHAYEGGIRFGPELQFGWSMADYLKESNNCENDPGIFLLKMAYGGRDIAIDFRSPRSGTSNFIDSTGKAEVKDNVYGWLYRKMIRQIRSAVEPESLEEKFPGYNMTNRGFEFVGLVWFQGFNDMIDDKKLKQYQNNLENLLKDLRDEFESPKLPVVLGELGITMKNIHLNFNIADMRVAQANVAAGNEWNDLVQTHKYFLSNVTTYEGDYHYNGRADTVVNIGRAFAESMISMMKRKDSAKEETAEAAEVKMAEAVEGETAEAPQGEMAEAAEEEFAEAVDENLEESSIGDLDGNRRLRGDRK